MVDLLNSKENLGGQEQKEVSIIAGVCPKSIW